jgi:Tfp pilus assembly protein PilV
LRVALSVGVCQFGRSDRGFSLPEVVVAAGLLASALSGLAPLVAPAIQSDLSSRLRTSAIVAAEQKLEELLSAGNDAGAVAPVVASDVVDATGRASAVDAADAAGAVLTRRWWVEPLPANADALVFHVEVTLRGSVERAPVLVRLATIRRRPTP